MKTNKGFRRTDVADELRKAKRLEPIHKSGKERRALFTDLDEEEDDYFRDRFRRESPLDYLDVEE